MGTDTNRRSLLKARACTSVELFARIRQSYGRPRVEAFARRASQANVELRRRGFTQAAIDQHIAQLEAGAR